MLKQRLIGAIVIIALPVILQTHDTLKADEPMNRRHALRTCHRLRR